MPLIPKSLGQGQTFQLLLFVLYAVCINAETGSLCSSLPAAQCVCSLCWRISDGQRGALSACLACTKCHAKYSVMPLLPFHAPVCLLLLRRTLTAAPCSWSLMFGAAHIPLEALKSPCCSQHRPLLAWLAAVDIQVVIRLGHVASFAELGNPPVQLKVIVINEFFFHFQWNLASCCKRFCKTTWFLAWGTFYCSDILVVLATYFQFWLEMLK